jgi:Reverse transcriptase (RNA-dependent DNA polymerase)
MDDFIIFEKDMISINALKAQLSKKYEMKNLEELKYFLEIQVHRDRKRKIIHINQSDYSRIILERFDMQNSKSASTSLSSDTHFIKTTTADILVDQKKYQSMIESVMYEMLAIRLNLAQCI